MKKTTPTAGPSQRQLRVGELVRHALADVLARGHIADDVLARHVITVPEVRMSPDLRLATCYVMPLGGKDETAVVAALERNKKALRTEVAHRVNLRYAPELRFRRDETFDEANRIDRLLHSDRVRLDLDRPQAEADDEAQEAEPQEAKLQDAKPQDDESHDKP
ncbi:30S ribosome-binding factor RbfA [Chelatococcus reniformis]|uniref:Ribosome-binding factor A n=1 Tax=Chelatococcus reniformis TaxID=1494448 RepID=A0A916TY81_9HYPH|nr:30S ribosome-binding factor RbfA [Chelatococcus reniformis]GGC52193.1 ribosome-binding factor A [Chelatococcus reniformis]